MSSIREQLIFIYIDNHTCVSFHQNKVSKVKMYAYHQPALPYVKATLKTMQNDKELERRVMTYPRCMSVLGCWRKTGKVYVEIPTYVHVLQQRYNISSKEKAFRIVLDFILSWLT